MKSLPPHHHQAAPRNPPGLVCLAPAGQGVAQGSASTQDPRSPIGSFAGSWHLEFWKFGSWGSLAHKTLESLIPNAHSLKTQNPKIPAAQCGERECGSGEGWRSPSPAPPYLSCLVSVLTCPHLGAGDVPGAAASCSLPEAPGKLSP